MPEGHDTYYVIEDLTKHAITHVYEQYQTSFTLDIGYKLLNAIEENEQEIEELAEVNCSGVVQYAQSIIVDRARELSLMAKAHGHVDVMVATRDIGKKMSAVLGHNTRRIIASCYSIEMSDIDEMESDEL